MSFASSASINGKQTNIFGQMKNMIDNSDDSDNFPLPPVETPSVEQAESATEEINGTIKHRIFPRTFKEGDEFAIYSIKIENHKDATISYAGHYRPEKGEKVTAKGKWTKYKGRDTFKSLIMVPEIPKGAEGGMTWLKIAKIKGVGAVTIKKLVNEFGDELPEALQKSETMQSVIKPVLADRISEAYNSMIGQPKLVSFLGDFGLRETLIQKVIKRFGAASRKIVDENPWRLAETIDGIGFNKADLIGRKAGHSPDKPARLKAGLRFTLNQKTNQQGHSGLSRDSLLSEAQELLEVDKELISPMIDEIITDRDAAYDEDVNLIYPISLYKAEKTLASRLKAIMEHGDRIPQSEAEFAVEKAIEKLSITRDEGQMQAAMMSVMNPVSIITGGPGTGKSTTQKIVVEALVALKKKFVLAAPTGRAAKRLAEVSSKDASTCHRLLSYSSDKGGFLFDRSNPFTQDRFIIDEFSMIDIKLGSSFMDAIKDTAGITIVGDVDQLPSVGSGQVLKDMIDSNAVPIVKLKTIHRQSGDSGIVIAAGRINKGETPKKNDEKLEGFYTKTNFDQYSGDEDIVANVVDLMHRRLPKNGFDPIDDIQVLSSMKPGGTGINKLNFEIKKAINPGNDDNSIDFKLPSGNLRYSVGDRVMHTRNDYVKKIYNGEVGIVTEVDVRINENGKEEHFMKVDYSGHNAYYSQKDCTDVTMAWASTVHKSQGCEFPVVIFVCPLAHRKMLTRNLFYTAVTRAKKVCIVLGHENAIELATKTEDLERRQTGLANRLKNK